MGKKDASVLFNISERLKICFLLLVTGLIFISNAYAQEFPYFLPGEPEYRESGDFSVSEKFYDLPEPKELNLLQKITAKEAEPEAVFADDPEKTADLLDQAEPPDSAEPKPWEPETSMKLLDSDETGDFKESPDSSESLDSEEPSDSEEPPESENPDIPPIPEYIMGQGLVPEETLSEFLLFFNPMAEEFADELVKLYVEEAAAEGVNYDAAFAQMLLETGFLRYGGLVIPEMNNFCGLGAIGPGQEGEWFPDPRTGVRAHIQHLKAYASDEPLNRELVDPRSVWVRFGSSPKINGLSGTWAADPAYGDKINGILRRLYEFSFSDKYIIAAIIDPIEPDDIIAPVDMIEVQISEEYIIDQINEEVTE